ncbi:MAG: MATE family efflux transporter [Sphaerochaetaceae bacterium]|nr:MATE family efflux transporter [Sphaerochaetaceae bacterium]MDC7247117.1 MATE family efflux transporter [Sphaerochaetaceae bacterium]
MNTLHSRSNSTYMRDFYGRLIYLSVPIMIQNLLISSLSFIDTLMITTVSEEALAAVGLANQMFFLINLFYFGVSSGSAIFVAQYWGAQQIRNLQKTMGIALTVGLIGAFISASVSFFFPRAIMHIFSYDEVVVAYGVDYLRIVSFSYITTAVVMVFSSTLRSTTDARTPMYISVISLVINVILNYGLILGKLGFPRLEVKGAAIATLTARVLEMTLLLFIIYRKKSAVAAPVKTLVSFSRTDVATFFHTCLPVILNEMFWSLGMTAYKVAYAKLGTSVIASVNVSQSIEHLFFVVLIGVSNAGAIMLGNKIGENKPDIAHKDAIRLMKIAVAVGCIMGIALYLLSGVIPKIFSLSPYVFTITTLSLRSLSFLVPFKALSMMIVVGVLRSGGDTRFSMLTEISGVWGIGVPIAFISVLLLNIPIYYIYLLVGLEEIYKGILGSIRIGRKKWITRLVEQE